MPKNTKFFEDFPVGYLLGIFFVIVALLGLFVYSPQITEETSQFSIVVGALTFVLMIALPLIFYSFLRNKGIPMPFERGKDIGVNSSLGFIAGAIIFTWLSLNSAQSVSTFAIYNPEFSVFASLANAVNIPFWNTFIVQVAAPFAEETFFLFLIPLFILYIMLRSSNETNLKFLSNKWLGIIVVILVSSITFTFFHVQANTEIQFVYAAFLFRAILVAVVWLDTLKDSIKFSKWLNPQVGVMFAVGAHMANNIMHNFTDGGWGKFLTTMISGTDMLTWIAGGAVILFFIYTLFMAAKGIFSKFIR